MTNNPRLNQLYALMDQYNLDALVLNPSPTFILARWNVPCVCS